MCILTQIPATFSKLQEFYVCFYHLSSKGKCTAWTYFLIMFRPFFASFTTTKLNKIITQFLFFVKS